MPNRLIYESLITSRQISLLEPVEEVTFMHLIVTVDDYGRYYADPLLLTNHLFPRSKDMDETKMKAIIARLDEVGLIKTYRVGDEDYLYLPTWEKHQRIRNAKSKFPDPPTEQNAAAENGSNPQTIDSRPKRSKKSKKSVPSSTPTIDSNLLTIDRNLLTIDRPIQSNPIQSNPDEDDTRTREGESSVVVPPALASEAELEASAAERAEVYDLAVTIGLKSACDLTTADQLCADYSDDWVKQAIAEAGQCAPECRSWKYIKGILRNWEARGGPENCKNPPGKKEQQSTGTRSIYEKVWS